jgi:hypothetical protein
MFNPKRVFKNYRKFDLNAWESFMTHAYDCNERRGLFMFECDAILIGTTLLSQLVTSPIYNETKIKLLSKEFSGDNKLLKVKTYIFQTQTYSYFSKDFCIAFAKKIDADFNVEFFDALNEYCAEHFVIPKKEKPTQPANNSEDTILKVDDTKMENSKMHKFTLNPDLITWNLCRNHISKIHNSVYVHTCYTTVGRRFIYLPKGMLYIGIQLFLDLISEHLSSNRVKIGIQIATWIKQNPLEIFDASVNNCTRSYIPRSRCLDFADKLGETFDVKFFDDLDTACRKHFHPEPKKISQPIQEIVPEIKEPIQPKVEEPIQEPKCVFDNPSKIWDVPEKPKLNPTFVDDFMRPRQVKVNDPNCLPIQRVRTLMELSKIFTPGVELESLIVPTMDVANEVSDTKCAKALEYLKSFFQKGKQLYCAFKDAICVD